MQRARRSTRGATNYSLLELSYSRANWSLRDCLAQRSAFRSQFIAARSFTKQRCTTPMRVTKSTNLTERVRILPIPILTDNYAYLIVDSETNESTVVDPAEPTEVLNVVKREGVELTSLLTTHHHWDHAGGNESIVKTLPGLKVYGGDERITSMTDRVGEGSVVKISKNLRAEVLFTPCHTSGHVVYVVSDINSPPEDNPKALFSGDTLFIGGCGRFFEGTAEEMYQALCRTLLKLPPSTLVFCGHEYTVKNLEFATTIEPQNKALKDKLEWAREARSCSLTTVPSTLAEERAYNPFMRVDQPRVAAAVGLPGGSPVEVMAAVRAAKDKWS